MASIIKMNSTEFFDFVDRYDHREFNFILVSQDIKTVGKYNTVYQMNSLIPPSNIISEFVSNGYSKKYCKKYLKYLSREQVEVILATIVKLATVEDTNVVLLCSDNEEMYKYLDLIGEFLKDEYKCKVCSYKKFRKRRTETDVCDNKKEIIPILERKLAQFKVGVAEDDVLGKKEYKKNLKDMKRRDILAFCEANKIKVDADMDKKTLIKKVIKHIFG